jgi:hypothetical protein
VPRIGDRELLHSDMPSKIMMVRKDDVDAVLSVGDGSRERGIECDVGSGAALDSR